MFASRLLGKNWLSVIHLKRAEIRAQLHGGKMVNGINFDRIQAIEAKTHQSVQELGTLKGIQARLRLKEGTIPKTNKPYRVPLAMRTKVESEYERLESLGILEKVKCI